MGPFGNNTNDSQYGGAQARAGGGGIKLWVLLLFGAYMAYYYFSHQQTVPLTGRKQMVDIGVEQEMALGLQSYQEILSTERVLQNHEYVDVVQQIGGRIAKAAGELQADPGFEWEYNVIESDQANAFCLPGGKVAVYTGILPVAQNTDALAAIMGHEIAHALAHHGAERMSHQKLFKIGTMAAGMSTAGMDPQQQRMVLGALGAGAQYGVMLPFSRNHESEADQMGLMLAAKACFDPRAAVGLWERMGQMSGGKSTAEFASTHPSNETRIRQIQEWLPKAMELRAQSGCPALPR